MNREITLRKRKACSYSPAAVVFLLIGAVYWFERGRNPGWGDSLGFLVSALKGFEWSVNATGHFLYNTLNVLLLRLFPVVDPVTLITASSIVFSIVTLWQIYRTALLVTGDSTASLAGTLILAFSFTFWRQAVSIEVYPLHLVFVATFLREITRDIINANRHHADLIGIVIGLALFVHIQTILLLPAFAFWRFSRGRTQLSETLRSTCWIVAAFLLLIIPAAVRPELTVKSVFFDFHFAKQVFALDLRTLITGFVKSMVYLIYNFHLFLPLIVLGAKSMYRQHHSLFIMYAWVIIPVWGFAFRYPISDNYVFFIPAYLVFALAGASGFSVLLDLCRSRKLLLYIVIASAVVLSPGVYWAVAHSVHIIPSARTMFLPVRYKGGAAYYLWPGMRQTPDPLILVRRQYPGGERPSDVDNTDWEHIYPLAVNYLGKIRELPQMSN